jgi:hypothetical protein
MVAGGIEGDSGHEGTHQENASPAGFSEEGVVGRVWQQFGGEARAFVGDFNSDQVRREPADEMHFFRSIFLVAVNDGVDQGLVDGQVDTKHVAIGPVFVFQFTKHFLKDTPSGSHIAGEFIFALPGPRLDGRGHEKGSGFGVQGSTLFY